MPPIIIVTDVYISTDPDKGRAVISSELSHMLELGSKREKHLDDIYLYQYYL